MNIKKADDKLMDIHTKKKMRIHTHKDVKHEANSDRNASVKKGIKHHGTDSEGSKGKPKKKFQSNTKRFIKAAEVETTKAASEQLEGGAEVHQASLLAYEILRPVSAVAGKGTSLLKETMLEQKRRKCKIVTPMGENSMASKQSVVNKAPKTAVNKQAAGEVAGRAIDYKDMRQTVRNRKIKFFLDKMKAEQKQTDSVAKMVRDIISSKAKFYVGKAAVAIFGVLGGSVSLIALIAIPIVLIITLLYNSPLALFLPPLTTGDTVQMVTNTYVAEFISEVETLANDHTGYDEGEIIYRDPDGNVITPMPQQDIMSVYMVEYGVGDTASIMNDGAKRRLKNVVEDMCQYTTDDRTEERKDENNKKYDVTILEVNVVIKDYQEMVAEYRFSQEQITLIEQMMNY